jgi:two-component system CheB/CheR fusion protein
VNAELRSKLDSISSAKSDLQNLMQATEIGTLLLDTGLRIRMFTPRITDHVKLTDADVGRSITDFAHRLVDIDVERDAAVVLRELAPVEREVATVDGRWLTMRLRPYRTVDDRIDGVVVTFVDVTERRAAEAKLRASEEKYRALFESIGDGVLVAEILRDEQGRAVDLYYLDLNPAGLAIVPSPLVGRRLSEVRPAFEAYWWEIPARVARTGEPERHELYAGPLARWYEIYVWRLDAETDRVAILFRDTTERRRALDALKAARDLLEIATAASGLGWITVDMAHGTVRSDQRARELLGLTQAEIALAKFRARLHDDDRATVERELEARARDGECFDIHARVRTGDGRERRVRLTGVFERAGEPRTARASALVGDADGDRALPRG